MLPRIVKLTEDVDEGGRTVIYAKINEHKRWPKTRIAITHLYIQHKWVECKDEFYDKLSYMTSRKEPRTSTHRAFLLIPEEMFNKIDFKFHHRTKIKKTRNVVVFILFSQELNYLEQVAFADEI